MFPEFQPLFKNPHLATIAGNFWHRQIDTVRFPPFRVRYQIDAPTAVLAIEHQPQNPIGQIVCLHGLEGSADAGYIQSLTSSALERGFGVHRLNLRTCGGTEDMCQTMYHSGLTGDTWFVLQQLRARFGQPLFLIGFSLGGNVALKLAGEYPAEKVIAGVCGISTPIDLAACVRAIDKPQNLLYARRFLSRLKARVRRKSVTSSEIYDPIHLSNIRTIWEFDDHYTAPLFGFGTAANYYATQSAENFLGSIRARCLLVAAQDDPLVPFEVYRRSSWLESNEAIKLISPRFGGHLGFISRRAPRFWVDNVILSWIGEATEGSSFHGTVGRAFTSS